MRLPLRVRVLLIVSAINLVVYGAGFALALRQVDARLRADSEAALAEHARSLFERLQATIGPAGQINVGTILRWPTWRYFDDALIVHNNMEVDASGRIRPLGPWLNPLGRLGRDSALDEQAILRDLARVIAEGTSLPSHGGTALPILDQRGQVWGACWFALAPFQSPVSLPRMLLPWFLLSTVLITLATFWLLGRAVLDPVQRLSEAASRLAAGDLSARAGSATGELGGLTRTFDRMAAQVEGYSARLAREVADATEQVRRAESAAMTQRRLAATGELAAGIAHEINNPLGGLINAVDALDQGELPPAKRRQYLQLLRGGLERIQRTVGQLLRFTPRSTGARAPIALLEPVSDAIALVQHRARALDVEVTLRDEHGRQGEAALPALRALPPVLAASDEMGQVVLNLLVNALDALEAAHRAGRVDVTLARADESVLLVVEDDGPGVAREELARVADLFYTTKEVGKGTGLGLSIVHRIVADHRGAVHLASTPGRGFRVEIRLPAQAAPARREEDSRP